MQEDSYDLEYFCILSIFSITPSPFIDDNFKSLIKILLWKRNVSLIQRTARKYTVGYRTNDQIRQSLFIPSSRNDQFLKP